MVGLGNVDNTSDANKPVSTAAQTALDLKANLASPTFTGTVSGIDKTMVGLSNVDNTSDANKPTSAATQSALDLKANLASPTFTGTVSGIDKTMVGLSNVDNTSDANKPVSAATQSVLDLKANLASPTFTGSPLAPTPIAGVSNGLIATTEFVTNAVATASANTSSNLVNLTTDQSISGVKSFSADAVINGITVGRGNFNENSNTAVGLGTLANNAGYANTGVGRGALASNGAAGGNTALGYIALSNNVSGTDNVAIGTQTLQTNVSGSQNTAIGKNANVATDGISNSVAIGANAIVTSSNTIQLGSDGTGSHAAITDVKTSGAITAASFKVAGGTAAQFLKADGSVSTEAITEVADEFSATASQTSFTLTQTKSPNSKVKMYINGIRISNTAYSVSGNTLTYIPSNNGSYSLSVNDRIQFDYFY
jgi:hypothetical protein